MKRKQVTCRCPAYPFHHRMGGGKCTMPDYCVEIDNNPDCYLDCPYFQDQTCPRIDWEHNQDHRDTHPSLTTQERNSDFRNW